MAGVLVRTSGVFVGAAGKRVRVDLRSDGAAGVVQLFYAGEKDGDPPFQFTIRPGRHELLIAAVGSTHDQRMRVVEVAGGADHHLKNFFWSTQHFHTTLVIEGV